jgi:hypothetical protein
MHCRAGLDGCGRGKGRAAGGRGTAAIAVTLAVGWATIWPIAAGAQEFDQHFAGEPSDSILVESPAPLTEGNPGSTDGSAGWSGPPGDQADDGVWIGSPSEPSQPCHGDSAEGCWPEPSGHCPPRHCCLHRLFGPACPRIVFQADVLMLWQGNLGSRPLFASDVGGATALDANQAGTEMAAGPRLGLLVNLDECYAIEGNWFRVGRLAGAAETPAVVPPNTGFTELDINGFNDTDFAAASIATSGWIQSAEFNWRRRKCGHPLTWLAGFRWVEWNADLQIRETATGLQTLQTTRTDNDLYGGQIGADLDLWNRGGPFVVDGIGKAGLFYNHASQRSTYVDTTPTTAAASAGNDGVAFFGEVGLSGSLAVTRWLWWRTGYSLFWINGVAVPADQLSVTNLAATAPSATVDASGGVFLHGVSTGLEARW